MSRVHDIIRDDFWFVGEDKVLRFTVYQDDEIALENISGWTTSFQMSNELLAAPFFTAAGVNIDPLNGVSEVTVPGADTLTNGPGLVYYSFRRTNSGSASVLVHGTIVLQRAAQSTT